MELDEKKVFSIHKVIFSLEIRTFSADFIVYTVLTAGAYKAREAERYKRQNLKPRFQM